MSMSECFYAELFDIPVFLLGVFAGLILHLLIRGFAYVLVRFMTIFQPLIMELCMLGNLRLKFFGINVVFINPFLARQVRLRLKSL